MAEPPYYSHCTYPLFLPRILELGLLSEDGFQKLLHRPGPFGWLKAKPDKICLWEGDPVFRPQVGPRRRGFPAAVLLDASLAPELKGGRFGDYEREVHYLGRRIRPARIFGVVVSDDYARTPLARYVEEEVLVKGPEAESAALFLPYLLKAVRAPADQQKARAFIEELAHGRPTDDIIERAQELIALYAKQELGLRNPAKATLQDFVAAIAAKYGKRFAVESGAKPAFVS